MSDFLKLIWPGVLFFHLLFVYGGLSSLFSFKRNHSLLEPEALMKGHLCFVLMLGLGVPLFAEYSYYDFYLALVWFLLPTIGFFLKRQDLAESFGKLPWSFFVLLFVTLVILGPIGQYIMPGDIYSDQGDHSEYFNIANTFLQTHRYGLPAFIGDFYISPSALVDPNSIRCIGDVCPAFNRLPLLQMVTAGTQSLYGFNTFSITVFELSVFFLFLSDLLSFFTTRQKVLNFVAHLLCLLCIFLFVDQLLVGATEMIASVYIYFIWRRFFLKGLAFNFYDGCWMVCLAVAACYFRADTLFLILLFGVACFVFKLLFDGFRWIQWSLLLRLSTMIFFWIALIFPWSLVMKAQKVTGNVPFKYWHYSAEDNRFLVDPKVTQEIADAVYDGKQPVMSNNLPLRRMGFNLAISAKNFWRAEIPSFDRIDNTATVLSHMEDLAKHLTVKVKIIFIEIRSVRVIFFLIFALVLGLPILGFPTRDRVKSYRSVLRSTLYLVFSLPCILFMFMFLTDEFLPRFAIILFMVLTVVVLTLAFDSKVKETKWWGPGLDRSVKFVTWVVILGIVIQAHETLTLRRKLQDARVLPTAQWIRENTNPHDVIFIDPPQIFSLFTQRYSVGTSYTKEMLVFILNKHMSQIDYAVVNTLRFGPHELELFGRHPQLGPFTQVFKDLENGFIVYKKGQ